MKNNLKKIKKDIEKIERQKEKMNRGLDQELSELVTRRKKIEEEKFEKLRTGYIGKCFAKEPCVQGEKTLHFLIIAKDPANASRMECLIVEDSTVRLATMPLFVPDMRKQMTEKSITAYVFNGAGYREISAEQFGEKLGKVQSRIDRALEQCHIPGMH